MARSPFILAAAVTAALPGAEVVGARSLTGGGDGRFDSAVATLADGTEAVIRVAGDDDAARELSEEAVALRALTSGTRALLPFRAPHLFGKTQLGGTDALVTDLLPGFQIDASQIPEGRGAAESVGKAIAALHTLPTSVARNAGLRARSAADVRADAGSLVERAATTGHVPRELTQRWRAALENDDLWNFESVLILGGLEPSSFVFGDDPEDGPYVSGLVHWRGLGVGDPAEDLSWLLAAPAAAADVLDAYERARDTAWDTAVVARARFHSELQFAEWLVHGQTTHRDDIIADAAALLASLAEGVHPDDLRVPRAHGVDEAQDALASVPVTADPATDTSMQTDAYDPGALWAHERGTLAVETEPEPVTSSAAAAPEDIETQDMNDLLTPAAREARNRAPALPEFTDDQDPDAERAARAALNRWTSSGSE